MDIFESEPGKLTELNGMLTVYTNPVINTINIVLSEVSNTYKTDVLNSAGQVVLSSQFLANREVIEINFSTLEDGFYFLMLVTDNQIYVTRIIK